MNLKTGEVKQRQLSELSIDFPRINEEYTGRYERLIFKPGNLLKDANKRIGLENRETLIQFCSMGLQEGTVCVLCSI